MPPDSTSPPPPDPNPRPPTPGTPRAQPNPNPNPQPNPNPNPNPNPQPNQQPNPNPQQGAPGAAETSFTRTLTAIDRGLGLAEQILLAALLLTLVGIGAGQAVATQLGTSWLWSYEVIRYMVFFIAMTGAALSAHTRQLIAMDFITRMLAPRHRARLRVGLRLFTAAVCLVLAVGGMRLSSIAASELDYHVIRPALGLLALPIGAVLIAVHCVLHALIDLSLLGRGIVPAQDSAVH